MFAYFLCMLSQKGPFLLRLHRHKMFIVVAAVNFIGVNLVPSCEPSQNGCVLDKPQAQYSYSFPISSFFLTKKRDTYRGRV
jgi:hypothetical protein